MLEKDYTFTYISDQLKDVIDELNLSKVSVVGESFGGIVAQQFTIDYPTFVSKLVVLSSLAKTELPPDIQWKLDYLLPVILNIGQFAPSLAQMLFAYIHVYDVVEADEPNYVKQLFIKEASFAHFFSVMSRIKIASKLDIVSSVRTIKVPTLILYGTEDHFTKRDSFRLHTLIQSSQLQGIPGGHLCHITSPKLFSEHVDRFIK